MTNTVPFKCGLEATSTSYDIQDALEVTRVEDYDFTLHPIVLNGEWLGAEVRESISAASALERFSKSARKSDETLAASDWSYSVVGTVTSDVDKLNSQEEKERIAAEEGMHEQISWAGHLGLSSVMVQCPAGNVGNFARHIYRTLLSLHAMKIVVRVNLGSTSEEAESSWKNFSLIRSLCDHSSLLFVALEIGEDLPGDEVLARWMSEPVYALIFPTSTFTRNKKNFPCLTKKHQDLVIRGLRHEYHFIISGERWPGEDNYLVYAQYLSYLSNKSPIFTTEEEYEKPYFDYLQMPLQPLQDHLESNTYEVFEKDPVKYQEYENAVREALVDKYRQKDKVTIMVVGAGRGPLVECSMRAALAAEKKIKLYAVEKNPNAIKTLTYLQKRRWGSDVELVFCDMRDFCPDEKADILVSELLGSFGDNELSPECLDGAQRFLADDGISIPSSYTSFLSPLSSSKLYQGVQAFGDLQVGIK
mmetsp:Transcript_49900/g.128405  ORF Transcript_49900/g.128405 Transcript_49900/m.128405 type:complete len:475 (-) Transcript_49900:10-1434(-)